MSKPYSDEFKYHALYLLKPPYELSVKDAAQKKGIALATLYRWIAEDKANPMPEVSPVENWTPQQKHELVNQIISQPHNPKLLDILEKQNVPLERIEQWGGDFEEGYKLLLECRSYKTTPTELIAKVAALEQELRQKNQVLADVMSQLAKQNKLEALLK